MQLLDCRLCEHCSDPLPSPFSGCLVPKRKENLSSPRRSATDRLPVLAPAAIPAHRESRLLLPRVATGWRQRPEALKRADIRLSLEPDAESDAAKGDWAGSRSFVCGRGCVRICVPIAGRTLEWLILNRLHLAHRRFEHLIPGHLTLIMILENDGIRSDAICETEQRPL